jgi:hypothetical protein
MVYENGTVYIADGMSANIKIYAGVGTQIDKWNVATNMEKANGLALDKDNMYIADSVKKKIFLYSRSTRMYQKVAIGNGGSDGELSAPADIAIYKDKYFVSDQDKGYVFVYDKNFSFLYTIGRGKGGVTLKSPRGIDIYQDRLYVADMPLNRVIVYTLDGYPIETLDSNTPEGNFSYPEDIVVDSGKLYVADTGNKIVKVFAIAQTTGNDSVSVLIKEANDSIADLASAQAAAQKLGVAFNQTTFSETLASAQADYRNFMFFSASSSAQKVIDGCASEKAALSQRIEFAAKKKLQDAQAAVAPYRQAALGSVAAELAQIDNTIVDVNAKLSLQSYSAAADAANSLPALTSKFVADAKGVVNKDEEQKKGSATAQAQMQIDSLSSRLGMLKDKAASYRQQYNLSKSESMIASAQGYVQDGDFESANQSLALAAAEISAYENSVAEIARDADSALTNITVVEYEMNASAAKPTLIPADLSPERLQLAQAKETLYINPQLAVAMAKSAADSASNKVKNAQALSLALAALLIMTGMAALLAVVFFLHLRGKKRHEHEGAEKR